jgi:hypothetical protein
VKKIGLFLAGVLFASAPNYASSLSISPKTSQSASKNEIKDPRLAEFPNLFIVDHPLVHHKLTLARSKQAGSHAFRQLLSEIALLIGYEITRSLRIASSLCRFFEPA